MISSPTSTRVHRWLTALILTGATTFLASCGGGDLEYDDAGRPVVELQMDWFAQPEHGGFYHAVANGLYEEAGLTVNIAQGIQNTSPLQLVVSGRKHFSIGSSDAVLQAIAEDLPIVIVGAQMQHDPQGIMVHAESGVETFKDLDGKTIMAGGGAPFLDAMKTAYGIDFNTVLLDGGMARFLEDKDFVQQCFITSEPYYVALNGANPKVLWLAEIDGYDPYRVIYTHREFAAEHPEVVRSFMEATIRGWREYLAGDREQAEQLIATENTKMADPEYRTFAYSKMREYQIVEGFAERGEDIGVLKPERIQRNIDRLLQSDLLARKLTVAEVMTTEFLPESTRLLSEAGSGTAISPATGSDESSYAY
ncbi:MAG: ABC transporter substrate-binding protein [Opitutales bacterium]